MNTSPNTLDYIQLDQPIPNFVVQLETRKTDFRTFQKKKWVVLFTHPEHFIPKNISSFKKFILMRNFLEMKNTKLLGLNPDNAKLFKDRDDLGKNSKIIICDNKGIVRSIQIIQKMDYKLIKNSLMAIQLEDEKKNYPTLKTTKNIDLFFQKTDQQGFQPTHLFYKKNNHN